jgi:hypothetical protein
MGKANHIVAARMRCRRIHTICGIRNLQEFVAICLIRVEFTHPGGAGRLTKQKGGVAALWKGLAGKKQFPLPALIETESLAGYLRALETRR